MPIASKLMDFRSGASAVTSSRVFTFSGLACLVCALTLCSAAQQPAGASSSSALDQIVKSLEQKQVQGRAEAKPYSIVREYRLFSGENAETPESVVVARVEFVPPSETSYSIVSSTGSSRGVGIVKRVLDSESQIKKEPQSYGINSDNYKFSYEGEQQVDGHRCYVLALEAKRKDHHLLDGRAWVDAESYQVRLVRGEPARSPSWWLKKVDVTMRYGDIGGVWAPLSTQAVADVRWFGKRLFTSRELAGSVGSTVAEIQSPMRRRVYGTVPAVVGAAIPHR